MVISVANGIERDRVHSELISVLAFMRTQLLIGIHLLLTVAVDSRALLFAVWVHSSQLAHAHT